VSECGVCARARVGGILHGHATAHVTCVGVYVCVCVCMCVFVYIYIYIYIHIK